MKMLRPWWRKYAWLRPLMLIAGVSGPLTYATAAFAMGCDWTASGECDGGGGDGGGGDGGGGGGSCPAGCHYEIDCGGTVYPDGGMSGACGDPYCVCTPSS